MLCSGLRKDNKLNYIINLTDAQDKALKVIASTESEEVPIRTPQEVIDEQVNYYIKCMLTREAEKSLLIKSSELDGLTDTQAAELAATLINTKQAFFNSLVP